MKQALVAGLLLISCPLAAQVRIANASPDGPAVLGGVRKALKQ